MTRLHGVAALTGRLLLSAIFLISGAMKIMDRPATVEYMASTGIPKADILVWGAIGAELLGGLFLLAGFLSRWAALGLVIFLVPTTVMFHQFWTIESVDPQTAQIRTEEMFTFLRNLAVMGGLLMIVAVGPGGLSIDSRRNGGVMLHS